jgi:hypothetical protein
MLAVQFMYTVLQLEFIGGRKMQELLWLDHLPDGRVEGGIELANRLYWSITWQSSEQGWYVWSGEKLIFRADSEEAVKAFLYGLGLAYAVLPEPIFEQLQKEVRRLVGE